jgi:hypothetical protein
MGSGDDLTLRKRIWNGGKTKKNYFWESRGGVEGNNKWVVKVQLIRTCLVNNEVQVIKIHQVHHLRFQKLEVKLKFIILNWVSSWHFWWYSFIVFISFDGLHWNQHHASVYKHFESFSNRNSRKTPKLKLRRSFKRLQRYVVLKYF